ncbi:hypothetical protein M441DRAFT_281267 [Trichoderma asperellum CBS 433.97]|uniref:Uncharacterized protein n=1 Tax=Trichoderma asperellum (strain ATCC 204424 / CBS 433.97 / NBRC 101777) TaxID=1042311 RepID=A0A2T3YVG0_TRIA4|nr:hypothetical protein M441DRAFT_281267 [Trichoderma asperellum CBS 433.97]PTB36555.1 hypothetical protein M441DRAFT_281267 [Trichoderma asperellum CBS 433.97]
MSLALPFVMESSRNLVEAALNPSTYARSSAPTSTPTLERYFPEDPFSGGIIMATFDGKGLLYRKDTYFQAKLTTAERVLYEGQDVYLLSFELNFMRSFSPQYRFRGADVNITFQRDKSSDSEPSITKIFPSIIAVDVGERNVQDNAELTAGAGASAGPGQINASAKQIHNDKTTFEGRRKFLDLIKGDNTASWRLYEEPGSQSGIPAILRLATLVRCLKGGFKVQLEVSVRMAGGPKLLGLHKLFFDSTFKARSHTHTISAQPIPFDWRKLYEEAKNIFPDNEVDREAWNRDISEFFLESEAATRLTSKQMKVLVGFCGDFGEVGGGVQKMKATALARLKEDLSGDDESKKFIQRLKDRMGISVPDKQNVSSETATETARENDASDLPPANPQVDVSGLTGSSKRDANIFRPFKVGTPEVKLPFRAALFSSPAPPPGPVSASDPETPSTKAAN